VAIPVVVWLLVRRFRLVVTEGRWAVPGFVVGAAPWLAYNVANSWTGLQQTPTPVPGNSYLDHLKLFVSDGLPLAMGLRVPLIGNAVPSPALANFLYGAFVVLVAFAAWSLRGRASVLLLVVVAFPFLLAVSKQSFHLIDGRYIGPLVPILILLLVGGAYELHPRIGVPVLAIAVALFGYLGLGGLLGPSAPDSQQVVHALEGLHVDHAYADYWIAYSYTFASDEKIVITSLGPDRYKPYTEEVARSEHPAFIFFTGSELDLAFQHSLTVDGITATRVEPAPGLVVYLPAQKLVPFVAPGVLHFDLAPPS
jgi:hypothetical protein